MTLVPTVNYALGILAIGGQALVGALIISLILRDTGLLAAFVYKNAVLLSFLVVLAATLGSLFYSEIAGYEPCKLCWLQRICMYPLALFLGMALFKKDRSIIPYAFALSGIGAVVAGYHYLLQIGVAPAAPCSAIGLSPLCSERFVLEFGYITIPLAALTAFALVFLIMLTHIAYARKSGLHQAGKG